MLIPPLKAMLFRVFSLSTEPVSDILGVVLLHIVKMKGI